MLLWIVYRISKREKRAKKRINATIVTTIHEKSYTNTGIIGITVNPIMEHISQIAIFVL